MPTGVTPIIAVYGSEGSCWDLPGVSEADCQAECRANRRAAFDAFPNQDICADCTRDADCGAGQYCKGNTCAASECDADGDCAEGLFCRTHRCVAPGVCAPPTCTMVGDEQICGMVGLHGSCLDSTRCGEGMVCGAYEGAKRCTTVCRQSCREGLCSDARDAEGRGLCLECKTDAHCSTGGPCRSDGRCGCFEDTDCPTRTCLRTRL
jgi:Cys-rich repeat protein